MRILFVWPNRDRFGCKPMGISLLSALCKKKGSEIDLFDTSFYDVGGSNNTEVLTKNKVFKPVDYVLDVSKKKVDVISLFNAKLDSFKPDVVAFSVLYDEVPFARTLADQVHLRYGRVAWGGNGAKEALTTSFGKNEMLFLGEAIETFPSKEINPFYSYHGVYKSDKLFKDLDSLPYLDWSIFDDRHFLKAYDGKVYRGGDHMIGWGCPGSCSYCINESWREMYPDEKEHLRRYSVNRIIDELVWLKDKWRLEFFKFHDEDFLLKPPAYFAELAEAYKERVGLPFVCMTNAKSVNVGKVRILKDMGCVSVSMGFESGHPIIRQILRRRETMDEIIAATSLLKAFKIRTVAFNMIGLPFETLETVQATYLLNRLSGVDVSNVAFYMPLPGTKLAVLSELYGFYDPKEGRELRTDRPSLKLPGISQERLLYYYENFSDLVKAG